MRTKYLLASLILSAGLLIGCNNGGGGSTPAELDYTEEEAIAKTKKLAEEEGLEVTIHAESTDSDPDSEDTNEDVSFGYTSEVFWIHEEAAYKKVEGGMEIYTYNTDSHQYEGGYLSAGVDYDSTFEFVSIMLFNAYLYEDTGFQFTNKHDTTFLGRSATQYDMKFSGYGASVSWTVVIDKDTGMTLKVAVSGSSVEGDSGAASFEVTSLKIGSQVQAPNLIKIDLK